jgi:hypothetical protein
VSLVIEALRRVEKVDTRPGTVGAFVTSYRPPARPRPSTAPLLLGLLTGGVAIFFFSAPRPSPNVPARTNDAPLPTRPKGAAGLPPPLIIESALRPAAAPRTDDTLHRLPPVAAKTEAFAAAVVPGTAPKTEFVLQAISERDSRPIAIINDQLVREGEKLGSARILHIAADSVEVMLESGARETVRFAPPPAPTPEARPTPSPHP